ncbi:pirin family protein [Neisseriaceae bacterium B1]
MTIQILDAYIKDVGGIPIHRVLPQKGKRNIGAWCFLDHAGPTRFGDDERGMQVGAHPHTRLQTFTWMIDGEVRHKDSLGNETTIRAGEVNLMTAGDGISHTEQTPANCKILHAVQLWIALPENQTIEPSFHHYPDLPKWHDEHAAYVLTTGTFADNTAPTLQYSPIVGVDVKTETASAWMLPLNCEFEYGVFVISGSLKMGEHTVQPEQLLYVPQGADSLAIEASANTHFLLIGGAPLQHEPLIWWNFVAPDHDYVNTATRDWQLPENRAARFGQIDSDLPPLVAPKSPWDKSE